MTDRNVYTSISAAPVTGPDYMDNIAEKLGMLFNSMVLKPTSITASGNQYTIVIDPVLNADVGEAMGFYIKPDATNTGDVELRVTSSNPYYDVTDATGAQLAAGEWNTSTYYLVVFLNGAFRVLSTIETGAVTSVAVFEQFDDSGTWTKPVGLSADAIVIVEAWGGGGGGGRASSAVTGPGGGGGAYVRKEFKAGDLASTVSVTIGAAGAGTGSNSTAGGTGGTTTFGGHLSAYGGGGGSNSTIGGGGGGATSAGLNTGVGGGPVQFPANALAASSPVVAYGGTYVATPGSGGSIFGGGAGATAGGGGGTTAGGASVYGGGGGAGTSQVHGASQFGGNGGIIGTAGSAPGGGGGGGGAAGAKGRVIVRIIP